MAEKIISVVLLLMLGACGVFADNLLVGDTDCEEEIKNLTSGPWTNHNSAVPRLKWDRTSGFRSSASLHVFNSGAIGMQTLTLPRGTYTLSCWARGDSDSARGSLTIIKRDINWHVLAEEREKTAIRLTTAWKRYSLTFESDGKTVLVPHFGIFSGEGWFDRFMIRPGAEAGEWENSSVPYGRLIFPDEDRQIFELGKPLPVTVEVHASKLRKQRYSKPLNIVVSNHFGKTVLRESVTGVFDGQGRLRHKIVIPGTESGWFRIAAGVDGLLCFRDAVVIARPARDPLKDAGNPFVGLYAAERMPDVYRRLGVGWLDLPMDWRNLEPRAGKYEFASGEMIRKFKEQGFNIKLSIFTCAPPWLFSRKELDAAEKLGTYSYRLMVTKEQSDTLWRKLAGEFLRRYGRYVDIFEIGAEIDAMVGLASYNKSLEPEKKIANFAGGETLDRICRWFEVTAEEIRKARPDAVIAAVRPSDVDARYKYAYSSAIFERCGKWVDLFGIDCYPQPRWIGPAVPPTGTEQQLRQRFADARNAMKNRCAGDGVFVSEYGYFVDVNEIFNPEYLMVQVNRMSRSFLQARLLGMKHLSYFHGGRSGLEGNRYHMGLFYGTLPLPALGALSTVADTVNNVTECRELRINPRIGGGVFRHADGSASAALWSIPSGYAPEIRVPELEAVFLDAMGNPLKIETRSGYAIVPLFVLPIYVRARDYAALEAALAKSEICNDSPLSVWFRQENTRLMNAYLQNNSSRILSGKIVHPAGERRFKLEAGASRSVRIPAPPPEKPLEYQIHLNGEKESRKLVFKRSAPMTVLRNMECRIDDPPAAWKGITPLRISGHERVMPLDHTTYSGAEDLSGNLYLAHDGTNLMIAVDVTDDHIRKGDCLELGFDPLNNHPRPVNGSDPDDVFLTLRADGGFQVRGARAAEIQKVCRTSVTCSPERKRIVYQLSVPLQALHERLARPGNIFGFNLAICDDDSGSGADYWLELRPGLLGGVRPDLFLEVTIE